MKFRLKGWLHLFIIADVLGWFLPNRATAQTFTTLYNFPATSNFTNSGAAKPGRNLTISGNKRYGATLDGGQGLCTAFSVLHAFLAARGRKGPKPEIRL